VSRVSSDTALLFSEQYREAVKARLYHVDSRLSHALKQGCGTSHVLSEKLGDRAKQNQHSGTAKPSSVASAPRRFSFIAGLWTASRWGEDKAVRGHAAFLPHDLSLANTVKL